jgi:hypothetical protein
MAVRSTGMFHADQLRDKLRQLERELKRSPSSVDAAAERVESPTEGPPTEAPANPDPAVPERPKPQ